MATQANTRADALANQVANLDNYRPVAETSVHFAFNKADLTAKAKTALDQLLAEVPNTKGYLVVVEGDTDSVGSANYNYKLSERRADAVVQYLSSKNIPAHKIYLIGLGKDKYVAENNTADGRAKNRRVDVRLMTNITTQGNPKLCAEYRSQPEPVVLSSPGTLAQTEAARFNFLAAFKFQGRPSPQHRDAARRKMGERVTLYNLTISCSMSRFLFSHKKHVKRFLSDFGIASGHTFVDFG